MSRLEKVINKIPDCRVIAVTDQYIHGVFDKPNCTGSFSLQYNNKEVVIARISESFLDRIPDLFDKIKSIGLIVKLDKPLKLRSNLK